MFSELRRRAEQIVQEEGAELDGKSEADIAALVHELRVHQIQLEMQNEELRRSQAELEESRRQYANLYDFAPAGYFIFDRNGIILNANLTASSMLRIERAYLILKPFDLFVSHEDKAVCFQHRRRMFSGESNGESCELKLIRRDRSELFVHIQSRPVLNPDGGVMQCRSSVIDITDRKRAEDRQRYLMDRLEAKNKELARFSDTIRHDFGNAILSIDGFSKELTETAEAVHRLIGGLSIEPEGKKEELRTLLKEDILSSIHFIQTGIQQMNTMLTGLGRLSSVGRIPIHITSLNMNKLIQEIAGSMKHQFEREGILFHADPLPDCLGDAGQVTLIFTNLLTNAVKYKDSRRPCRIHIRGEKEGGKSVYCVEDNGVGIRAEDQERIFDAFFRIRHSDDVKGDGLGLSIVSKIVELHHGEVRVESEVGKGSRFIVKLPHPPE